MRCTSRVAHKHDLIWIASIRSYVAPNPLHDGTYVFGTGRIGILWKKTMGSNHHDQAVVGLRVTHVLRAKEAISPLVDSGKATSWHKDEHRARCDRRSVFLW